MAQSNVMVTYAPARRAMAPATGDDRAEDRHGQKRWGIALAGALLAGGAVFALGTFVRPDGSIRDAGFSARPGLPLANTKRETIPAAAPALREAGAESRPAPLPYIAVVRDIAPPPTPPVAARRPLSAPAAQAAVRPSPGTAISAAIPASDGSPADVAGLAEPAAPEPVTGQRRDLEGFLGEQGLVLAVPVPASDGLAPVTEWTPDDLAAAETIAPSPAPVPGAALAEAGAGAPADPGMGEALAPPEHDTAGVSSPLVEVPETTTPEPIVVAETQHPAATEPVGEAPPDAAPVRAEAPGDRDRAADPTARLAVASGLVLPGAGVAVAPVAAYAQSFPMAVVNGDPLGAVTLRDLGPQGHAVHLGALVGLLKLRMPEAEFVWLSSAAAADQFVTLDRLRAAGIAVQFDSRGDRLLIDAR